jgi:L-alanine-DL-glutamate epimerase-like enolase superfamily enzyme
VGHYRQAAGQPLYKLWGAAKDRVPAYASMIQLSTPEERVRMVLQLKSQGWKAIKLWAQYQTSKEDVRLVEAAAKRWATTWRSWWMLTRRNPPERGSLA